MSWEEDGLVFFDKMNGIEIRAHSLGWGSGKRTEFGSELMLSCFGYLPSEGCSLCVD